jgi:DNA-binding CsgD family transcriptional regulator
MGNPSGTADCLSVVARLELADHRADRAVRLLAAAATLSAAIHANPEWLRREAEIQAVAEARQTLGQRAFDAAWAAGRVMSVEQAVRLAFEPVMERSPLTGPASAGLTARELDVVRLIARGRTNDQIAGELFVSVKTVEKHVGNILGKLGFENRAQVAAWAIEHGLAQAPDQWGSE